MSFDFGEEQLTQPSLDVSEPQGYNAADLLDLLNQLSCRISEILPGRDSEPVTLYLGGDAAAVLNNFTHRSYDGIHVFTATPLETRLIARVVDSLELDNGLRIQLADTNLQDAMDAVPQIMQRLTTDAARIEPIYSCPALTVIIPRWEIPYTIKMHELAFDGHDDSALRWASRFLVYYLFTTKTGPSLDPILESSIQEHIQAFYPQEKGYVPRSTLDKVNCKCKEHFYVEPIRFEG
jgi:hypothetical protein